MLDGWILRDGVLREAIFLKAIGIESVTKFACPNNPDEKQFQHPPSPLPLLEERIIYGEERSHTDSTRDEKEAMIFVPAYVDHRIAIRPVDVDGKGHLRGVTVHLVAEEFGECTHGADKECEGGLVRGGGCGEGMKLQTREGREAEEEVLATMVHYAPAMPIHLPIWNGDPHHVTRHAGECRDA